MRVRLPLFLLVAALAFAGCGSAPTQRARTAHVQSDGTVSVGVRSAADGNPGVTGPQEYIGAYLPIPTPWGPLALKASLSGDLQFPIIIGPPAPVQSAPLAAGPCAAPVAQAGCAQTVTVTEMVPETYMETETRTVPKTRMVPRTRQVPVVPIPVPQAVDPCAPKEPPPEPVACADDHPTLARG